MYAAYSCISRCHRRSRMLEAGDKEIQYLAFMVRYHAEKTRFPPKSCRVTIHHHPSHTSSKWQIFTIKMLLIHIPYNAEKSTLPGHNKGKRTIQTEGIRVRINVKWKCSCNIVWQPNYLHMQLIYCSDFYPISCGVFILKTMVCLVIFTVISTVVVT